MRDCSRLVPNVHCVHIGLNPCSLFVVWLVLWCIDGHLGIQFQSEQQRNFGATAVIGKLIYLLGGWANNAQGTARISSVVNVFNTTSRTMSVGVPMTAGRYRHAAASFNNKLYIFGGRSADNLVLNTVEEFDPATGRWAQKAQMPEAWELMSTGPMPVYANGEVLIPFSRKNQGTGLVSSLRYSVRDNQWQEAPVPPLQVGVYAVVQGAFE